MPSSIEWTNESWNPVVGCTRVSEGCRNCYAEKMSARLAAMAEAKHRKLTNLAKEVDAEADTDVGRLRHYTQVVNYSKGKPLPVWNNNVETVPDALTEPLHWKKTRRIFVNSMSDLFHKDVPFEFIDKVFAVMALCPQHTFQILTKRPERMAGYLAQFKAFGFDDLARHFSSAAPVVTFTSQDGWSDISPVQWFLEHFEERKAWPLPNAWLGTSVESADVLHRLDKLRQCRAAIRFLSCEPLLGPLGDIDLTGIDWVIVGGESGPGARPMHPDWARSIRDQCVEAGVPYFFKQWGAFQNGSSPSGKKDVIVLSNGQHARSPEEMGYTTKNACEYQSLRPHMMSPVGKKAAGRLLDGREWNEFPEVSKCG